MPDKYKIELGEATMHPKYDVQIGGAENLASLPGPGVVTYEPDYAAPRYRLVTMPDGSIQLIQDQDSGDTYEDNDGSPMGQTAPFGTMPAEEPTRRRK